jgi:membrane-associated phospholipid phosphatase
MMIQASESDSAAMPHAKPARASTPPPPAPKPQPEPASRYLWWPLPALLVIGFGLLIWQVKTNGPVTTLDTHVRDHIQAWAKSPSMRWSFHPGRALADLGNESFTFPILIAVTALAARAARSWRPVLIGLGAFATLGTVIALKMWINRPGPGKAVFGNANLGFFPSGHTADAVLAYGTSALLLCVFVLSDTRLNADARRSRQAIVGAAIVLVLATIFGLLWSNFHWLSDTVGSLCWCGAALAVMCRYATIRTP